MPTPTLKQLNPLWRLQCGQWKFLKANLSEDDQALLQRFWFNWSEEYFEYNYSLSFLKVTLVNLMLTEVRGQLCGGELYETKEF